MVKLIRILIGLVVPLPIALGVLLVPFGDSTVGLSDLTIVRPPPSVSAAGNPTALDPENVQRSQSVAVIRQKPWEQIDFPHSRKLTNNVWGAATNERLTTWVYLDQDGNFGSSWSRPDPKIRSGLTVQPIYPNVRIGGSPWQLSNCEYFPIKLSETKSLIFDLAYQYPTIPSGTYNLSYDLFLSDTNKHSDNPEIKAEIMIWIHGTKKQPSITYKGEVTDGYNTYELYSWTMLDGRLYYSFIMKGEPRYRAAHTVDARRLMDTLQLNPNWYIAGIELGNEVWHGSGKLEIQQLSVKLNDCEL